MNYIRHLNAFFSFIRSDNRLTSSHVSLYLALFQYWNFNRFQNPFPIYRENIMEISKIGSKNTYHKCIRELHQARYICYHPALSKFQPVKISMIRLDKKLEETNYQQLDLFSQNITSGKANSQKDLNSSPHGLGGEGTGGSCPKSGTGSVPNLTPTSPNIDTGTVPKMGHIIKQNSKQENNVCNTPTLIFEKNREINEKLNNLLAPNHPNEDTSPPSVPPSAIVIPTEPNNQSSSLQNISDGGMAKPSPTPQKKLNDQLAISLIATDNTIANPNKQPIPCPSANTPSHLSSCLPAVMNEGGTGQNTHFTSSHTPSPSVISTEQNTHFTSSHTPSERENCPQTNEHLSSKNTNGMPSKKLQKPTPPTITMVQDFFKTNKYPLKEAQKFYYYNQGKNWMLTDKIPIQDWQSLAHKWMLNTKHTTKHSLPPPGGDSEGGLGGSGCSVDLSEAIQFLYDLYLQGTPISKQLQPEFADHLQLLITEKIMSEAIQRRINQLSGSNERSQNQLWSAYMQEDFQNPIIQNDYPNLLSLAKRLAVLKHFQKLKSKGATKV